MEMVRTEEIDKNQPIFTLQELQKSWGFLSVPMGLTVSPARWLAQQENIQAQQESNHNQDMKDMGDSAVKLTEESEADMYTDLQL